MTATTRARLAPGARASTGPGAPDGPGRENGPDGEPAPPGARPDRRAGPADRPRHARHRPARPGRWLRRSGTAAVTVVMMASPFLLTDPRSPWANLDDPAVIDLYSDGLAVTEPGGPPRLVPPGTVARYLPGSRVLVPDADAGAVEVAAAHASAAGARAWVESGVVPGAGGPYEDLARDALLDVHALLLDDGAAVAGWSHRWRYVWPRDASFVAVALARTGHTGDAVDVLSFLQRVQRRDGAFEARYRPDGSGPPDDRGLQSDGTGWVLWATAAVLAELPDDAARRRVADRLRPLVDRSTARILDLTEHRGVLPPPSADYWERRESRLTLGTAAPLLSGLHGAADVLRVRGEDGRARAARERADELAGAVERAFGPHYPRYAGGREVDAASAFLLPPFQPTALPGALAAWQDSAVRMARPAGGLAPGEGWKRDGISWTPQTALYAWVAAATGDRGEAQRWLTWLDTHRTPSGAIPEKVLADGSPAAVAPLAWSAACVLLALDELDASTA